jgi:hypothetical protein
MLFLRGETGKISKFLDRVKFPLHGSDNKVGVHFISGGKQWKAKQLAVVIGVGEFIIFLA